MKFFIRFTFLLLISLFIFSCATKAVIQTEQNPQQQTDSEKIEQQKTLPEEHKEEQTKTSDSEQQEQIEFETEEQTKDVIDEDSEDRIEPLIQDLVLNTVFAGDIMAHEENFSMKKPFSAIWEGVKKYVENTDLAFANIEAPVYDEKDWQSYPTFNMKSEYVEEAIKTGFNVFSLANNHTNDQGVEGMKATYSYFKRRERETKGTSRAIYSSGVKQSADAPLTYQVIEKDGWTVLFVAITEVLNSFKGSSYIDYVSPTEEAKAGFIKKLASLKAEHPCDLFVLSLHCSEAEYVRSVLKSQREYYYKLIREAGVDIVWANHPHVAKVWDIVGNKKTEKIEKMIMYALGNTISGQRRDPQFNAPETARDYTGDGFFIQVKFVKKYNSETKSYEKCEIEAVNPVLITTYIDPSGDYILKELNPELIKALKNEGDEKWASYLEKRMNLMNDTKGTVIWQ